MAGVVLAAGAGTRMGQPKALVGDDRGMWLPRAVGLLLEAGCDRVLAVLGASAHDAARLLPDDPRVTPLVASEWEEGIGASLRAALDAAARFSDAEPGMEAPVAQTPVAVAVTLVDLPHLDPEALRRILAGDVGPTTLRRAVYSGAPGHPVLIGRDHWASLGRELAGDRGAGPYLASHGADEVDCTGLGGERDQDVPLG